MTPLLALGFLMGFLMGTQDLLTDPKEFMDLFMVILSPTEDRCRSSLEALKGTATRACTIRAAPRGHPGAWTLQAIPGRGLFRSAWPRP